MPRKPTSRTQKQLIAENERLRARLDKAEEAVRAIGSGDADPLVVPGAAGDATLASEKLERELLADSNLSRLALLSVIEDQTQATEKLRLRESYLTAIFENQRGLLWLKDADFRFLAVNQAFADSCGKRSSADLAGKTDFDIWPKELAEKYRADDVTVIENKSFANAEELVSDRGETKWFETFKAPIFDSQGDPIGTTGYSHDITERKRAENERTVIFEIIQGSVTSRNLDEFLKLVHRSISKVVYAENCFVMLHDPATDMMHFEFWVDKYDPCPTPQPLGKGFTSYVLRTGQPLLLTEESRRKMQEQGNAKMAGTLSPSWVGVPLRTPTRTIGVLVLQHYEDEHAYIPCDLEFLSSVGDQIALAIERIRTAKALIESEERYRDLVENAIDMIFTQDLDGNYTSINSAAEKITGYKNEETLTRNLAQSVAPEKREEIAAQMRSAILVGREAAAYEVEIMAKDGRRVTVEVNTRLVYENGVPVGVQGVARDITERKQTQEKLAHLSQQHELVLNSSAEGILGLDLDGRQIFVNPAAAEMLGYEAEELLGRPSHSLWHHTKVDGTPYPREECAIYAALNDGKVHRSSDEMFWQKDGTSFPVEFASTPMYENGELAGAVVTFSNITQRKQAEQALQESEAQYRELFDGMMDGVYRSTHDGRFVDVNDAMVKMFGYSSKEEMLQIDIAKDLYFAQSDRASHFLDNGVEKTEIFRMRTRNGSEIWVEDHGHYVHDEQGNVIFHEGTLRDITQRKQAEDAAAESEERYRDLVENAVDIIFTHDLDGNYTSANKAVEDILGFTVDEALTKNLANIVVPEDIEKGRQMVADLVAGMDAAVIELEVLAKDGHRVAIEVNARSIIENGVPVGIQGVARDITERRNAEFEKAQLTDHIERQRGRLDNIISNLPGLVWETTGAPDAITESNYFVSEFLVEMLGYSVEEWRSNHNIWFSLIHPDDRERVARETSAAFAKGDSVVLEFRWIAKDGRVIWVEGHSVIILDENGTPIGARGLTIDITERKQAEEARRASEERYRELVENASDIIYAQDMAGNFTSINGAADKITGYTREEMLTMNMDQLVAPEYREKVQQMIHAKLSGKDVKDVTVYENEIVGKDGRRVMVEVNTKLIYENGIPVGVQGIARDVTERKRADAELRESEEKYRTILENIEDGYYEVDFAGNFTFLNDSMCRIAGYPYDELIGMNNRTYMDDESAKRAYQTFNEVYRTGRSAKAFDWEMIGKDGTRRFVDASMSRREDPTGKSIGFRGIIRDITERKQLEDQFRQSQKLEAIGLMAGGVAHDFNNLLTAINGYSDLTLKRMPPDDRFRGNIEEIRKAGLRAAEITDKLLAFSRKQILQPRVHNLNTVIIEIDAMLRRIIRESVEFRTALNPELGNIKADPGQIEQVIMNLAINARDAMPDGGTLTLETQNVYLDEGQAGQLIDVSPGPFIKLIVIDTGQGMDEQTMRHIFEPFFTTKEVGKGTGLGLSTVHGIVKQSGGGIAVDSKVGHGTTFEIYLPCVDETVQKLKWIGHTGEMFLGNETILLVEDEDIVRKLVCEILTANGYHVLEAASGKAALSICKTYSEPIHLLLTDVIMPKMNGGELRDRVVKLRPDIKVLFMSGYTDDSIVRSGIFDSEAGFIEKPFTPDVLSRKIREVLEA